MQIISERIDGRLEAVLRDDQNNPLLTLPRYEEDGQEYLKVPKPILNYIGRRQANEPLQRGEKEKVYEIINELKRDISSLGRLEKFIKSCETEIETTCTVPSKKKKPPQTIIDTKI